MKEERILIVEDDVNISENIEEILQLLGYVNIDIANSANQAIKVVKKYRPDMVFMDIKLKGDKDGIELGEIIQQMVDAPIVYVTSYSDPAIIERAKRTHPAGFIVKPFNSNDIHAMVEIVLYNQINEGHGRKTAFKFILEGSKVIYSPTGTDRKLQHQRN